MNITCATDQTAPLSVQKGETRFSICDSLNGNALHVSNNGTGQSGGSLVEIVGTGQMGGSLVEIDGVTGNAFVVDGDETRLDPKSAAGGTLHITNSVHKAIRNL